MPAEPSYVIVGASLTGAKAAETLREEGFGGSIVLLGSDPERPYERPPLSKGYLLGRDDRESIFVHDAGWYAEHDVELLLGATAVRIDRAGRAVELSHGGRVTGVIASAGTELPADIAVIGIGVVPNSVLAEGAGLEVGNGILTDAMLRTSDPDIYAAGDVANAFNPLLRRRVRVEHWANALAGGPAAARSMLGGDAPHDPVPYFYSDQYDLGMETAGLPEPGRYDEIVYRGDVDAREFIALWLD